MNSRGEIAVRILSTAREVGLHTIAVTTSDDDAHSAYAHEAIQLPSATSYMDVGHLVSICNNYQVDMVHPGYGFLSESAEFCEQLQAAGITFVGPSPDILRETGDKLGARHLAEKCGVPTLPALTEPVDDIGTLRAFAADVGMPLMIKAVDGGGGRGIRLVRDAQDLDYGFRKAVSESPSKRVFAEKAALGGYRHIEVQILGDGRGNVVHFWERECSIQRRFQKVIEVAPSTVMNRTLISAVIDAAVRMAKAIKYGSLGTWEFLVAPEESTFYFMEINPRLQVEHTITESICGVDLVRYQLLLALGKSFEDIGLGTKSGTLKMRDQPLCTALQFRITAEDPTHGFSLSIGKVRRVLFPGGNGVRVDTHLRPGASVSTDFDPLLAKLIVTSFDWNSAVEKAERALQDVSIDGVTTNLSLLQGITRATEFRNCQFDTQWLEGHLETITHSTQNHSPHSSRTLGFRDQASEASARSSKSSDRLIRKGDRFKVDIEGPESLKVLENIVSITKVMRNDFPESLAIKMSTATSTSVTKAQDSFTLNLSKQSETQQTLITSDETSGLLAREDSPLLISPLSGQLVEVLVDDEDFVNEQDTVAIVRQMKMELDIRAHRSGIVKSVFDIEEGDEVHVGTVICRIVSAGRGKL